MKKIKKKNRQQEKEVYLQKMRLASPSALRKKWRRWLGRLSEDVSGLYRNLQIYKELIAIVRDNPKTLHPPAFFQWCRTNYIVAICIGIRRLSDNDFRSISLRRLLEELLERHDVLTRTSYRAFYWPKGLTSIDAYRDFDRKVGQGKQTIQKKTVRRDICKLKKTDDRIRRYVNKRLAHNAPLYEIRNIPTYDDIENALEVFDELATKYYSLLTGAGLVSFYSTPNFDWRQVLKSPWMDRDHSKWPEKYYGPNHQRLKK